MADVYFRLTGQPLVVYASIGPGPMNLMISVANAFYDTSAFMVITGNVPTTQLNNGALQNDYRYNGSMSFAAADQDDRLVRMPFVARRRAIPPDAVGKGRARSVDPVSNAFPTDRDAAPGEQVLRIGSARGKPMTGPNSTGDDLARETKAFQARH